MRTLIIGCGAAGAAAAVAAAQGGQRVTVLDRNRKPLKKLGVTGNGRGNLLNSRDLRYYGDAAFAQQVLSAVPFKRLFAFWEALGVPLCEDGEGRVYPSAYLASVAAEALLKRLEALNVELVSDVRVTNILPVNGGFRVEALQSLYGDQPPKANGKPRKGVLLAQKPVTYTADRVIVAVGGKAAPAHGTDGSAYSLLTALGHTLTPLLPGLCPLQTEAAPIRGLDGLRVRAKLTLKSSLGAPLHESRGEALFATDGVSGIAAMQLSRFYKSGCVLSMDLRESLTGSPDTDALAWLEARRRTLGLQPSRQLLTGAAAPALRDALYRAAAIPLPLSASQPLTSEETERLALRITDFSLPVLGVRGFEAAQVTAGGIAAAEFDPATMESRLVPGLYAAGEVLDVDGDCGGYNLMFALASGLTAGAV